MMMMMIYFPEIYGLFAFYLSYASRVLGVHRVRRVLRLAGHHAHVVHGQTAVAQSDGQGVPVVTVEAQTKRTAVCPAHVLGVRRVLQGPQGHVTHVRVFSERQIALR